MPDLVEIVPIIAGAVGRILAVSLSMLIGVCLYHCHRVKGGRGELERLINPDKVERTRRIGPL
jgi:hypothetical protein